MTSPYPRTSPLWLMTTVRRCRATSSLPIPQGALFAGPEGSSRSTPWSTLRGAQTGCPHRRHTPFPPLSRSRSPSCPSRSRTSTPSGYSTSTSTPGSQGRGAAHRHAGAANGRAPRGSPKRTRLDARRAACGDIQRADHPCTPQSHLVRVHEHA